MILSWQVSEKFITILKFFSNYNLRDVISYYNQNCVLFYIYQDWMRKIWSKLEIIIRVTEYYANNVIACTIYILHLKK